MNRTLHLIALLLASLCYFACEPWYMAELAFPEVAIDPPDSLDLDTIALSARLTGLAVGFASQHGFVWSTDGAEPTAIRNDGILNLGVLTAEDPENFHAKLALEFKSEYWIRAFAIVDGTEYYSESVTYRTGTGKVITGEATQEVGNITLTGYLIGTRKGIFALEHGFCWSTTIPDPGLTDEHVKLGVRRSDHPFSYTFQPEIPERHYFRAYAVFVTDFTRDTVFGPVRSFDIRGWVRRADIPLGPRFGAHGFSLVGKGYIGGGTGLTEPNAEPGIHDFWEYDPESNAWSQIADLPISSSRQGAVAFAIGNKAYVGTGLEYEFDDINFTVSTTYFPDFWEYDPETNRWTRRADFPGTPRSDAVGFSIGGKGYVGTGKYEMFDNENFDFFYYSDFWEYNPETGSWKRLRNFPGGQRGEAIGFAIADKGYIGGGAEKQGDFFVYQRDFWVFNAALGIWARRANIPGGAAPGGTIGCSSSDKGFILRHDINSTRSDFLEYDPVLNTWTKLADFPRSISGQTVSFSIRDRIYAGSGIVEIVNGNYMDLSEFWEYR